MRTQKFLLTRTENEEHRKRLVRLEKMGIPIECADDPSPEPDRFSLEQIQRDFARIYVLGSDGPSDGLSEVAIVMPARLRVWKSEVLLTDCEVTTSYDDFPLDLSDPKESPFYEDLIGGLPLYPTILNDWMTRENPLRPCNVEGVIIATGLSPVPPKCHDETLVPVKVSLWDERGNDFNFDFEVRMDRSLKLKYEWLRQRRRPALRRTERDGLYRPEETETQDQTRTTNYEAVNRASGSQVVASKYKV